ISHGGNTFNGTSTFNITNGIIRTQNNASDIYNGAVTYHASGNGVYRVANTLGTTGTFNNSATFVISGSNSLSCAVGIFATVNFNGNLTVINQNTNPNSSISFASATPAVVNINGTTNLFQITSGNGAINLTGNGTTNINQNLTLNCSSGTGVFSTTTGGNGTTNLNSGAQLITSTFSAGALNLTNLNQFSSTPQTLTLTGSGILVFKNSTFQGNLLVTTPRVNLSSSTFNGAFNLTVNGNVAEICPGGNTFNGTTTINHQGTKTLVFAGTTGDQFNGNVTFNRTGSGLLNIANNGTTTFGGNVSISGSSVNFGFTGGTIEFNGTTNQTLSPLPSGLTVPKMVVNKPSGHLILAGNLSITNSLNLQNGAIELNSNILTMATGNPLALSRTNGYVISETIDLQSGRARALSRIRWNIGTNTGSYLFPFGTTMGEYIPVTFAVTTPGSGTFGSIFISTYPTPNDNKPYPTNVHNTNGSDGQDNSANAANRFWRIFQSNYTTLPIADISFTYDEIMDLNGLIEADLKAQQYNYVGNYWNVPIGTSNVVMNTVTITNQGSYLTDWTISNSLNPLPVEIHSFTGNWNGNLVQLNWLTGVEVNVQKYVIERSDNQQNIVGIGEMLATGANAYQFSDLEPLTGTSYYRLKTVDFDGTFAYSNWIEIQSKQFNSPISIYPNPVSNGTLTIEGISGIISLFDISGKLVMETEISEKTTLPIQSLPSGLYFLHYIQENQPRNIRIIIQ
ncbi:MAG: T9SS type A sorting domain-containing protein, partial [Bacteroidia bacterium]|nr:T9SS type A sorting domain-containing protein [Bacteroidia bacterium]